MATHPHHPDWYASTQIQLETNVQSQAILDFVEGGVVRILVTDGATRPVRSATVSIMNENRERLEPDASRYEREFAEAVRHPKNQPIAVFFRIRRNKRCRARPSVENFRRDATSSRYELRDSILSTPRSSSQAIRLSA